MHLRRSVSLEYCPQPLGLRTYVPELQQRGHIGQILEAAQPLAVLQSMGFQGDQMFEAHVAD